LQPVDRGTDRGAALEPSEVGTDAEVPSAAERQVRVRRSLEVGALRIGRPIRIAIRRRENEYVCSPSGISTSASVTGRARIQELLLSPGDRGAIAGP
jgi:hypothetical protein